jgi:hypothetical protein
VSGTTLIRRKRAKVRLPDPYVVDRADGRFDCGCHTCRVRVAGLRSRSAAEGLADNHVCVPIEQAARARDRPRCGPARVATRRAARPW